YLSAYHRDLHSFPTRRSSDLIAVLAGLFELIRFLGIFNTPLALIFSYMIFTLPFTVWVLTTFMRDLPVEIEEAAIVDGASPWVRSEEHTSELQSRENLVCRLL